MFWGRQLDAMVREDRLDQESLADLGITYAAETGDESLLESWVHMFSPIPYRFAKSECSESEGRLVPLTASFSEDHSGTRCLTSHSWAGPYSVFRFVYGIAYRRDSRSWSRNLPTSRSISCHGNDSSFR